MKVLVACEKYGKVRDSFRNLGADAWSCDVEDDVSASTYHIKDDVRNILGAGWDLMVAFPPCTHLAVSGARWFKDKVVEQKEALEFVSLLLNAPIEKIALENPVSVISTKIRKPTQIIQPWIFGHGEMKTTCLWLKNLPNLTPTDIVSGRESNILKFSPSENRSELRAITYSGIAEAMADQWISLSS